MPRFLLTLPLQSVAHSTHDTGECRLRNLPGRRLAKHELLGLQTGLGTDSALPNTETVNVTCILIDYRLWPESAARSP